MVIFLMILNINLDKRLFHRQNFKQTCNENTITIKQLSFNDDIKTIRKVTNIS